jgi:hypothetical protein
MPAGYDFGSAQSDDAVQKATREAFVETLSAGFPAFYVDDSGLNVMEAEGRRYEVRWLPGASFGENYEIVREVPACAA